MHLLWRNKNWRTSYQELLRLKKTPNMTAKLNNSTVKTLRTKLLQMAKSSWQTSTLYLDLFFVPLFIIFFNIICAPQGRSSSPSSKHKTASLYRNTAKSFKFAVKRFLLCLFKSELITRHLERFHVLGSLWWYYVNK